MGERDDVLLAPQKELLHFSGCGEAENAFPVSRSNGAMSKRLTSKSATPTSAKTKTVVIKGFAPAKVNSFKSSIETLSRAIAAIQSNPPVKIPESLQALYQLCEGIINSTTASGSSNDSESSQLYDTIKLQFEKKSSAIRRSLVAGGTNGQEEEIDWIRAVEREWKQYLLEVGLIKDVFTALDRSFVIKNSSVLSIWSVSSSLSPEIVVLIVILSGIWG